MRSKYLCEFRSGGVRERCSTSANRMLGNQIEIESIEIGFPLIIGRSTVTSFPPESRACERPSSSRLHSDPRFTDTANGIGAYDRIIELSSLSNRIKPQYYCRTRQSNAIATYNCGYPTRRSRRGNYRNKAHSAAL